MKGKNIMDKIILMKKLIATIIAIIAGSILITGVGACLVYFGCKKKMKDCPCKCNTESPDETMDELEEDNKEDIS